MTLSRLEPNRTLCISISFLRVEDDMGSFQLCKPSLKPIQVDADEATLKSEIYPSIKIFSSFLALNKSLHFKCQLVMLSREMFSIYFESD